jgi:hypothetical protein
MRIKITRTYTLPHSREGRGRPAVEEITYDSDDYRTPVQWAAEELRNAGCTRHDRGSQYVTEEPKITDFGRGEEMTAEAELTGFTDDQFAAVADAVEGQQ